MDEERIIRPELRFPLSEGEKREGKLDRYAWPGGYTILYTLTDYDGTHSICADCADRYVFGDGGEFSSSGAEIFRQTNDDEDNRLFCEDCSDHIECDYPPEGEEDWTWYQPGTFGRLETDEMVCDSSSLPGQFIPRGHQDFVPVLRHLGCISGGEPTKKPEEPRELGDAPRALIVDAGEDGEYKSVWATFYRSPQDPGAVWVRLKWPR